MADRQYFLGLSYTEMDVSCPGLAMVGEEDEKCLV